MDKEAGTRGSGVYFMVKLPKSLSCYLKHAR